MQLMSLVASDSGLDRPHVIGKIEIQLIAKGQEGVLGNSVRKQSRVVNFQNTNILLCQIPLFVHRTTAEVRKMLLFGYRSTKRFIEQLAPDQRASMKIH